MEFRILNTKSKEVGRSGFKILDSRLFNQRKNSLRGFTLIELLVVISIISILSSVVLASLNAGRIKANDNAVKAEMKQLAIQAETYRDSNLDFGQNIILCTNGVFGDPKITQMRNSIQVKADASAVFVCRTDLTGSKWSISISALRGGGSWCIDNSTGWFKPGTAQSTGICS